MGTRQEARWSLKWSSLFASVALLGLAGVGVGTNTDRVGPGGGEEANIHQNKNNCNSDAARNILSERNFLIVSTMDGKVSALNLEKGGQMEWTVDVGAMPLLSSSISDLVMTRNNIPTRLIPSLDGSLFQFDSENQIIEALPFTADTLLSSSFKLNYDSTIVGGKESATYGVEVRTGKIRYICTTEGCTKFDGEAKTDTEDVLVLTRHTKTVRAVEMRTGIEKWNFSVGQHEVSLVSSEIDVVPHLTAESLQVEGDEDSTVQSCPTEDEEIEDDWFEFIRTSMFTGEEESVLKDLDLKVIVPKGLVIALSRSDPGKTLWSYQFKTPIANAWILENHELSEVSLFNDKVIPALMEEDIPESQEASLAPEPLVYIGIHDKQYYVQPSVRLRDEVQDRVASAAAKSVIPAMPRIRWSPYIASAPSRTPVVTYNQLQIGYNDDHSNDEGALTVRQDQYPFENVKGNTGDMGWYLMADTTPAQMSPVMAATNKTNIYTNLTLSLWNWKEVIAISLITSILVHIILVRFFPGRFLSSEASGSSVSQSGSSCETIPSTQEVPPSPTVVTNGVKNSSAEHTSPEYLSRFATEFDMKQCLGRGGFGVVFEALNKMDDCGYAIKRITLNNSKRAREKVMREVKALAKLEHPGIVRYYQAWFENPPAGWQEKLDSIILDMPSFTPTPTDIPVTSVNKGGNKSSIRSEAKLDTNRSRDKNKQTHFYLDGGGGGDADNPLKMFGGLDRWGNNTNDNLSDFSQTEGENVKKAGGSAGFLPRLNNGEILEESRSYSLGTTYQRNIINNSYSLDIEFHNSESGSSFTQTKSNDIPFKKYNRQRSENSLPEEDMNDSFNIVFEDSGCGLKGVNEEPSFENSLCDTQDTHCTDVETDFSLSHSPSKQSVSKQPSRPGSLPLKEDQVNKTTLDLDSLVDPNAPKLYLYIQMQLCRQDSLKDWLNCNTLQRDRSELLDIFDQIVCAVDYIHDNGLMHRDLKPSNIFFSLDGTVRVGDFGLVTTLEEDQCTPASHTPQHSAQHTGQVGTRLYMSPEQVAGQSYNQKVDIFSLGLIVFELFYPFATQMERIQTLLDARQGKLPPRFVRELPDECVFVRSLLDSNPERRPTTKEIQQNPLLRDFEVARQTVIRVRPRTRTTSSSGSANSLSSSQ